MDAKNLRVKSEDWSQVIKDQADMFAPKWADTSAIPSYFLRKRPELGRSYQKALGTRPLTEEELDDYLDDASDDLRQMILQALGTDPPSHYSYGLANELLRLEKLIDILNVANNPKVEEFRGLLSGKAMFICARLEEYAEREFRDMPSSDFFFKWMAIRRLSEIVGVPWKDVASLAPPYRSLGDILYIVKLHNTLSKLAFRFYGYQNLWDIIYWRNFRSNFHPNLIYPGQKLILP